MPYCNFAIIGLSEMKVKSLRRHVNGRGTIRAQKMSISVTRRRKTWRIKVSKRPHDTFAKGETEGHASNAQRAGTLVSRESGCFCR
jgi:hypothetical protein